MLLSRHLEELNRSIRGRTTLGQIVEEMRVSGFCLMIIFFSLPFLQPIPMAGLSTALGALMAILSFQMILKRKSVWLPQALAKREISAEVGHALLKAAAKFFKFVEKFVRPRLSFFASNEALIGFLIFVCACILLLPIPVPLSNMTCAIPIVLLCLAHLEKDGLLAMIGMFGTLLAMAFHIGLFVLGFEGVKMLYLQIF